MTKYSQWEQIPGNVVLQNSLKEEWNALKAEERARAQRLADDKVNAAIDAFRAQFTGGMGHVGKNVLAREAKQEELRIAALLEAENNRRLAREAAATNADIDQFKSHFSSSMGGVEKGSDFIARPAPLPEPVVLTKEQPITAVADVVGYYKHMLGQLGTRIGAEAMRETMERWAALPQELPVGVEIPYDIDDSHLLRALKEIEKSYGIANETVVPLEENPAVAESTGAEQVQQEKAEGNPEVEQTVVVEPRVVEPAHQEDVAPNSSKDIGVIARVLGGTWTPSDPVVINSLTEESKLAPAEDVAPKSQKGVEFMAGVLGGAWRPTSPVVAQPLAEEPKAVPAENNSSAALAKPSTPVEGTDISTNEVFLKIYKAMVNAHQSVEEAKKFRDYVEEQFKRRDLQGFRWEHFLISHRDSSQKTKLVRMSDRSVFEFLDSIAEDLSKMKDEGKENNLEKLKEALALRLADYDDAGNRIAAAPSPVEPATTVVLSPAEPATTVVLSPAEPATTVVLSPAEPASAPTVVAGRSLSNQIINAVSKGCGNSFQEFQKGFIGKFENLGVKMKTCGGLVSLLDSSQQAKLGKMSDESIFEFVKSFGDKLSEVAPVRGITRIIPGKKAKAVKAILTECLNGYDDAGNRIVAAPSPAEPVTTVSVSPTEPAIDERLSSKILKAVLEARGGEGLAKEFGTYAEGELKKFGCDGNLGWDKFLISQLDDSQKGKLDKMPDEAIYGFLDRLVFDLSQIKGLTKTADMKGVLASRFAQYDDEGNPVVAGKGPAAVSPQPAELEKEASAGGARFGEIFAGISGAFKRAAQHIFSRGPVFDKEKIAALAHSCGAKLHDMVKDGKETSFLLGIGDGTQGITHKHGEHGSAYTVMGEEDRAKDQTLSFIVGRAMEEKWGGMNLTNATPEELKKIYVIAETYALSQLVNEVVDEKLTEKSAKKAMKLLKSPGRWKKLPKPEIQVNGHDCIASQELMEEAEKTAKAMIEEIKERRKYVEAKYSETTPSRGIAVSTFAREEKKKRAQTLYTVKEVVDSRNGNGVPERPKKTIGEKVFGWVPGGYFPNGGSKGETSPSTLIPS